MMSKLVTKIFLALMLAFQVSYSYTGLATGQATYGSVSSTAQILGIAHAVHLRPTVEYGQEIQKFGTLVGKNPALLMYFMDWQGNPAGTGNERFFDPYLLNIIQQTLPANQRPVIMLSWQPLYGRAASGCSQNYSSAVPLTDILNGACDEYIQGFATALKARPERIIIRFAHEMNITDSPWWVGHVNASPALYVNVWRHIHQIFSQIDVPNVEWIWSPNYKSNPDESWNSLHAYYPGNEYVDWIGLSSYNWYSSRTPAVWQTFSDLYSATLQDLTCSYPKPQILAEIGSVDGTGGAYSKSAWIADAYQQASYYPFVRAVQWFNDFSYADPSNADFRVTSGTAQSGDVFALPSGSSAWTDAYRSALGSSIYTTTLPSLANATPPGVYCNGQRFTIAPNNILMTSTDSALIHLTGIDYATTVNISASPLANFSTTIPSASISAPWGQSTITLQTNNAALGNYVVSIVVTDGAAINETLLVNVTVVNQVVDIFLPFISR